jgi:hypothetical protein
MEGWGVNGLSVKQVLRLPEKPMPDPETEAHYQQMALLGSPMSSKRNGPAAVLAQGPICNIFFSLPRKDAQRLLQSPPACRLWLEGQKLRPEVIGEIPLRAGARLFSMGFGVAIQEVADHKASLIGGFDVKTMVEKPTYRHFTITYSQPSSLPSQGLEIMVLDRLHARASLTGESGMLSPMPGGLDLPASYGMRWMNLPAPQVWRKDRLVEQPEHFADYTLAAIAYRPAGRWTQSLEIERLVVTK